MILMYLLYHVKWNSDWRAPTLRNLTPLNKQCRLSQRKACIFSLKFTNLLQTLEFIQVYADNELNIHLPSQVTNSCICALSNDRISNLRLKGG